MSAMEKLTKLFDLRDGWAFGEGKAFSTLVKSTSIDVLAELSLHYPTDVFPGRQGQIIVTMYTPSGAVDVIVDDSEHLEDKPQPAFTSDRGAE